MSNVTIVVIQQPDHWQYAAMDYSQPEGVQGLNAASPFDDQEAATAAGLEAFPGAAVIVQPWVDPEWQPHPPPAL